MRLGKLIDAKYEDAHQLCDLQNVGNAQFGSLQKPEHSPTISSGQCIIWPMTLVNP
jgi:hypothetical protein